MGVATLLGLAFFGQTPVIEVHFTRTRFLRLGWVACVVRVILVSQPIISWLPVFVIEPCFYLSFEDRAVVFWGPSF